MLIVLCAAHAAFAYGVPPHIVDQVQRQYAGRVVGVSPDPSGRGHYTIQLLRPNGHVIILIFDERTGVIIEVRQ